MTNDNIVRDLFKGWYTVSESSFCEFTNFIELKYFDVSGLDDCTFIHLGLVNGKPFWYKDCECRVYNDDFSFFDEMKPES